jgi:hypothetical protein
MNPAGCKGVCLRPMTPLRRHLAPFLLGAAAALLLHVYQGGWWLDAGPRVFGTLATVAVVAALLPLPAAIAFAAGVAAGKAGTLMVIGPGSIFPIVIAIGTVMIAVAAAVGCAVRFLTWELGSKRLLHR